MSMQVPTPNSKFLQAEEKPLIQQHNELQARAKELEVKLTEVAEVHGDLSEIEAALEIINQERAILKEKKELRYAEVKEVLVNSSLSDKPEKILSNLKEDCLPFLRKALGDEDWHVRAASAEVTGLMGSSAKEAVPPLIDLLNDNASIVRAIAVHALAGVGSDSKEVIPALIKALAHDDPLVLVCAAASLKKMCPEALPFLVEALNHENSQVRRLAVEAIGSLSLKDSDILEKLKEISLSDSDEEVRKAAIEACRSLKEEA